MPTPEAINNAKKAVQEAIGELNSMETLWAASLSMWGIDSRTDAQTVKFRKDHTDKIAKLQATLKELEDELNTGDPVADPNGGRRKSRKSKKTRKAKKGTRRH